MRPLKKYHHICNTKIIVKGELGILFVYTNNSINRKNKNILHSQKQTAYILYKQN